MRLAYQDFSSVGDTKRAMQSTRQGEFISAILIFLFSLIIYMQNPEQNPFL